MSLTGETKIQKLEIVIKFGKLKVVATTKSDNYKEIKDTLVSFFDQHPEVASALTVEMVKRLPLVAEKVPSPRNPTQENMTCVVCMNNTFEVVCVPCFHICLCTSCSDKLYKKECPKCRTEVTEFKRFFMG